MTSGGGISVAMCTRNGAVYVGAQLRSIAQQTTPAEEVIICDDDSTDGTADIVSDFAKGSGLRVRVLRNSSALGCTKNFERAIGLCTGEFVVLADQDDIWKAHKLAAMATAFARQAEAGYVFSDAEVVNQAGQRLGSSLWQIVGFEPQWFTAGRQVAMLLKRNLVTGATMGFRRRLRDIALPIPAGWSHDYWIALLGSVYSFGVPIVDQLLAYRRHMAQHVGCGRNTLLHRIKMSVSTEPDYAAQGRRIAELRERVLERAAEWSCPAAHWRLIKEKELHLARRALIRSAQGRAKIGTLLREAASGRYQRYSFSWGSMVRDLTATKAAVDKPVVLER